MGVRQKFKLSSGELPSLDRILDAAENEFAKSGYFGAGMKAIAQGAEVAQGLLHYHYGTKEGLYEAVIARRAKRLSADREAMLAKVDLAAPDALESIFDALYRPTLEEEGGARAYGIILSGKYVGDRDSSYLVNKYYDPTANRFIDAILIAEPRATRETASWSYLMAIGAMMTVIGQDGRQEQLAGKPPRQAAGSVDDIVRPLVLNAVGGLRELVEGMK